MTSARHPTNTTEQNYEGLLVFELNVFRLCIFSPAGAWDDIYFLYSVLSFCIVASAVTLSPPATLYIPAQMAPQFIFYPRNADRLLVNTVDLLISSVLHDNGRIIIRQLCLCSVRSPEEVAGSSRFVWWPRGLKSRVQHCRHWLYTQRFRIELPQVYSQVDCDEWPPEDFFF